MPHQGMSGCVPKGLRCLEPWDPVHHHLSGDRPHYGIWRAGLRSAAVALQAPGWRGAPTSLVVAYRSYELFKKRFPQIEPAVPDGEGTDAAVPGIAGPYVRSRQLW
jgi:hypothetical protein